MAIYVLDKWNLNIPSQKSSKQVCEEHIVFPHFQENELIRAIKKFNLLAQIFYAAYVCMANNNIRVQKTKDKWGRNCKTWKLGIKFITLYKAVSRF